jgi:hypothetical protein
MRLISKCLLGAAMGGALAAVPLAAPAAYEATTGQALHSACGGAAPHVCLSYLAGIVDMHEAGLSENAVPLFCPREAEPEKVGRSVWLFYEQHPQALKQPAAYGAVRALALMFPCD